MNIPHAVGIFHDLFHPLKNVTFVKRHLTDNLTCQSGFECENARHYLFDCPLFLEARISTLHLIDHADYNLESLLFGVHAKSNLDNAKIFEHVHNYINLSQRFNVNLS